MQPLETLNGLKSLGVFCLEINIIKVFKIMHGVEKVDREMFLPLLKYYKSRAYSEADGQKIQDRRLCRE